HGVAPRDLNQYSTRRSNHEVMLRGAFTNAAVAESYERIHRSNLIGMGVLPLEFAEGDDASAYGFTGEEDLSLTGLDELRVGTNDVGLHLVRPDGSRTSAALRLRLNSRQELAYLRHGGVLPYVARRA
ncbi:hypothetical protein KDA82_38520, partial [Streptomyces daliensis]|nr:hypothetical protein [Streptomyces daliensis]